VGTFVGRLVHPLEGRYPGHVHSYRRVDGVDEFTIKYYTDAIPSPTDARAPRARDIERIRTKLNLLPSLITAEDTLVDVEIAEIAGDNNSEGW